MEEKIKRHNPTLHRYLFTVTTFSKLLAMFIFIMLPFLGFYLGMHYQQQLNVSTNISNQATTEQIQEVITSLPKPTLSPTPMPTITTQPASTDISTWKTSSIRNLSFKIPSNWKVYTVDPNITDAPYYAYQDFGDLIIGGILPGPFSILVSEYDSEEKLISNYVTNSFVDNIKKAGANYNGQFYWILEGKNNANYYEKDAITVNNNKIYIFTMTGENNPTYYLPYFDLILSTLKFTQ